MPSHLDITIPNRLSELERIMAAVEDFGRQNHLSSGVIYALNLALEELLANTISYGYDDPKEHSIDIRIQARPDDIRLEIEDDGRPFNPLNVPPPDITKSLEERPIGGLGIYLVRQTMDDVQYERRDNKNCLAMTKKRNSDTIPK